MRRQRRNRSAVPAKAGTHANSVQDLCFLLPWMSACERVKNCRRAKVLGRSVVPAEAGTHLRACSRIGNGFLPSRAESARNAQSRFFYTLLRGHDARAPATCAGHLAGLLPLLLITELTDCGNGTRKRSQLPAARGQSRFAAPWETAFVQPPAVFAGTEPVSFKKFLELVKLFFLRDRVMAALPDLC